MRVHHGLSLVQAVRVADLLGVRHWNPPGTGELVFEWRGHKVRVNGRRKDVGRKLISLLRHAERTAA